MPWFFLVVSVGCQTPTDTYTNTDTYAETDVDTDMDVDTDTDTGSQEPVGGNCGGPEPPDMKDFWWGCDEGAGEGYTWPVAGGPADLIECLTVGGWRYTLSEKGDSVSLLRESDGRVIMCELID